MQSVDSNMIGIDKSRNTFTFTSKTAITIAVTIYKKDYVDGSYYIHRGRETFEDTFTFRMDKGAHYRFIFEYFKADTQIQVLVPPPDRNIAPPIPVRPEFPQLDIPVIPKPVDVIDLLEFPKVPPPPHVQQLVIPLPPRPIAAIAAPTIPELPTYEAVTLSLPAAITPPQITFPTLPTAPTITATQLPAVPQPPAPFNANTYRTQLNNYERELSTFLNYALNNSGIAATAEQKKGKYLTDIQQALTTYGTTFQEKGVAYKTAVQQAVDTFTTTTQQHIQTYKQQIDSVIQTYKDQLNNAIQEAGGNAKQQADTYITSVQKNVNDYHDSIITEVEAYNKKIVKYMGEALLYAGYMMELGNNIKKFSEQLQQYNSAKDTYNKALETFTARVNLYEEAKEAYYKIDYPAQYTAWRNDTLIKPLVQGTTHVEEFVYAYFPELIQEIISGTTYVLGKKEDARQLYNSKDNIAQTTILRMLYYNALVFNNNQVGNYGITLGIMQETLRYHSNAYQEIKGHCNIFMQEKYIIATYYLAYILEALKYVSDRDNVCALYNARTIIPLIRALNIDVDRVASHSGMILSNICKAKNEAPIVRDLTIDVHNRTIYTFSADIFLTGTPPIYTDAEDDPPNKLTIMSLPTQGIMKFKGIPVVIGQQLPFGEIDSLTYEPLNTDNTYIASFKFIIDAL